VPNSIPDYLHEAVRRHWADVRPEIIRCFATLWEYAELPGLEYESAQYVASWLEREGFDVERCVGGIPTAFKASWGSGTGPTIVFLTEYDALLGPENQATPFRRSSGKKAGHACGHNQIGGANAGAAIASKRALQESSNPGTVVVVGCPAEEIVWGKIALMHQEVFAGSDVLLTSHADYQNGAISRPCQSVAHGEFIFRSDAGHAGRGDINCPIEAVQSFIQTIMHYRVTAFPDILIRYVIRRGGDMPVVIPDEVRIWISARHEQFEKVVEAYDFIKGVAQKVANENGVDCTHQFISETRGYLPNDAVAASLEQSLRTVGSPAWTEQDMEWQKSLAASCSNSSEFDLDRCIGLYDEGCDAYGQDDGELSWHIPLGRVNWAMPQQVPLHHWACAALCGHEASYPGPLMASEALAITAFELFSDEALIQRIADEYADRTGGKSVDMARIGATATLTRSPEKFWDCTWDE
jgi:aminobenzoyl-glutamate utilization protein B